MVQLCAPAGVGGLERVVQGLTAGLISRGHEVALVPIAAPAADLTGFLDPLQGTGVVIHELRTGGRNVVREFRQVRSVLRAVAPHILHTHGYRSDLLHGWHARRAGIATVTTLHGSSRMGGLSHFFERLQIRALQGFDGVVAVSEPLQEELIREGVQARNVHMIPNAWVSPGEPLSRADAIHELGLSPGHALEPKLRSATSDRPPRESSVPLIGWVGRLIPIKGCDVFLEALATITDLRWQACVVGDGPERDGLHALASTLGLGDRIHFAGSVPEASRHFGAFDLFVLSSRSEGTPMVLLEAMGAGLPIVATQVGGVSALIRGEEEGWVVPPEAPVALGRAIRSALLHPTTSSERARRASERVRDEYGTDLWLDRHEALYQTVHSGRSGR